MIATKKDRYGTYIEGVVQLPVKAYVSDDFTELSEEDAQAYLDAELEEISGSNTGSEMLANCKVKIVK